MNRRAFLASPALAAILGLATRIRKRLARRFVTVGKGGDHETLRAAVAEVTEAGGGTVYLMPGHHEFNGPLDAQRAFSAYRSRGG